MSHLTSIVIIGEIKGDIYIHSFAEKKTEAQLQDDLPNQVHTAGEVGKQSLEPRSPETYLLFSPYWFLTQGS